MPGFSLSNLYVVHVYNYIKPKGQTDLLTPIEKHCHAVKLSTCMRHIYVFNAEILSSDDTEKAEKAKSACRDLESFVQLNDQYSSTTILEFYQGENAYSFLLFWMSAGLNPKKMFDDHRILGDVRAVWTALNKSTSLRNQLLVEEYKYFFNDLFIDVIGLLKLVDQFIEMNQETWRDELLVGEAKKLKHEYAKELKTACDHCAWTRVNGFLSFIANLDYASFLNNTFLQEIKLKTEYTKSTLEKKLVFSVDGKAVGFFKAKAPCSVEKLSGLNNRLQLFTELLEKIEQKIAPAEDVDTNLSMTSEIPVISTEPQDVSSHSLLIL